MYSKIFSNSYSFLSELRPRIIPFDMIAIEVVVLKILDLEKSLQD